MKRRLADLEPGAISKHFLVLKQRKNPGYSLRAFSRDLGISVSFVSAILNEKKSFPIDRFHQWSTVLEMDEISRSILRKSILRSSMQRKLERLPDSERPRSRGRTRKEMSEFVEISRQREDVIGAWYAVAILDLTTCADFRSDEGWIAKRLGVSRAEVGSAVKSLMDSGLLEERDGKWHKVDQKIRLGTTRSHARVRNFHRQMIQLALRELLHKTDQRSFDQRLITGVTIAVNPRHFEKAKKRLHEALYEAADMLTEGECTELYQLNLQFFPLTQPVHPKSERN